MTDLLQQLHQWDAFVLNAGEAVRWSPLTVVFLIASAWWVKGPLFVLIGACGDVRARRQFPVTASAAAVSALTAGIVSMALKEAFDRPRPGNSGIGAEPLVATPADPSFPSGHTLTAFAAAAVVSSFHPRLRWPLFGLAAIVGLSRIYLGVHFWLDVLAGAAAGVMVGLAAAWLARRRYGGSAPSSVHGHSQETGECMRPMRSASRESALRGRGALSQAGACGRARRRTAFGVVQAWPD